MVQRYINAYNVCIKLKTFYKRYSMLENITMDFGSSFKPIFLLIHSLHQ